MEQKKAHSSSRSNYRNSFGCEDLRSFQARGYAYIALGVSYMSLLRALRISVIRPWYVRTWHAFWETGLPDLTTALISTAL